MIALAQDDVEHRDVDGMLGLIAGNGRFPLLILEEALRRRIPMTVAAIREEADPAIEAFPDRSSAESPIAVHWVGLGRLGKLLKIFRAAGVRQAIMAGQVKHVRIFSRDGGPSAGQLLSALPDLKTLGVLWSLAGKNTQSLIGGFADALAREGIELLDSTYLVPHLLPAAGPLTRRKPSPEEALDIELGLKAARQLARLDIGQTVVIKDQAVVAVEAMEGTDETIRRAAALVDGRRLTVVKVSRPDQDMRFDVPVFGLGTLDVFRECRVSAAAFDADRTLLLDRERLIKDADEAGVALLAVEA